jgi:Leucine carboxyl methyltransferase
MTLPTLRWSAMILASTAATLILVWLPTNVLANDNAGPATAPSPPDRTIVNRDEEFNIYRQLQVPLPTKWRCGGLNRWSWKLHGKLLPLLHWGDPIAVPDVYVNLRVLWCKALSSFHSASPANDDSGRIAYYMLPPLTRWPLKYFWWSFPRWMHANIELRTAYLNAALQQELTRIRSKSNNNNNNQNIKICVVVLGGGYDPRAAKLLASSKVDRVYELDLPAVVQSKRQLLERAMGVNTMAQFQDKYRLEAVDLNDKAALDCVLDQIQAQLQGGDSWYTVLISEALLLYLNPGVAGSILKKISKRFGTNRNGAGASFVFADRLDLNSVTNIWVTSDGSAEPSVEVRVQVEQWLLKHGWKLQDFKSKTGATRHLGLALAV